MAFLHFSMGMGMFGVWRHPIFGCGYFYTTSGSLGVYWVWIWVAWIRSRYCQGETEGMRVSL